jgi:hypothetical protein
LPSGSVALLARTVRKRGKGVTVSTLMMAAGVFFAGLGAFHLYKDTDGAFKWLMLAFVFGSVGIGQRWSENRESRRVIAAQEFRGTVTGDGILLEEPTAQTLFRWAAFAGLDRHEDLMVAWLATGSALPLAPQMFANPADYQAASALLLANITFGWKAQAPGFT